MNLQTSVLTQLMARKKWMDMGLYEALVPSGPSHAAPPADELSGPGAGNESGQGIHTMKSMLTRRDHSVSVIRPERGRDA
ncbi:MAG: hypothetical protein AB7G13_13125 [Lautropia sp.]